MHVFSVYNNSWYFLIDIFGYQDNLVGGLYAWIIPNKIISCYIWQEHSINRIYFLVLKPTFLKNDPRGHICILIRKKIIIKLFWKTFQYFTLVFVISRRNQSIIILLTWFQSSSLVSLVHAVLSQLTVAVKRNQK
jgi:hypothetical protein